MHETMKLTGHKPKLALLSGKKNLKMHRNNCSGIQPHNFMEDHYNPW